MANLYLLAPAANLSFASLPSGSTYLSDANGLVVVSNGSAADQAALAAAGCTPLFALSVGASFATLAALYAADAATPFAQGAFALVFADGTSSNDGLWQKTGTGTGSGNWTQLASYTVASLQSQVNTNTSGISGEITRAEAAEAVLTGNVTTLTGEMATANAGIATNAAAIAVETTRAESAETANTNRISTETARAQTAEGALGGSIATLQSQVAGGKFNTGSFCMGGTPPGTVDAATTAALPTCTYQPEAAGDVLIGLSTAALADQDGVTIDVGTRLLVKNQAAGLQNGLYACAQQGDGESLPWILRRAADAYTAAHLGGIECLVNAGTSNGGTIWLLPLAAASIVVGATALAFAEVANGLGAVTTLTAASYTLQPGDNNSTIVFSNASAVAVTLPNSLPVGFRAKLIQGGAGQVSVSAGSGASLDTPNQSSTPGQYATLDCFVTANAGSAAVWDAIASAPPNAAAVLVVKSANFTAAGSEGFIECNAAGGAFTITVPPSVASGRVPLRLRKIDTSTNAVSISDGTNVVFALTSAANSNGNLGGWCDVSSNGTNLRTEGVP
ncbi:MAG: hypothetical protein ACREHF_11575 [Rhizomicrobium sp.]